MFSTKKQLNLIKLFVFSACSFLYIGEYTISQSTAFTSVTATSGEDCLQKCVDNTNCQVASYLSNNCQHSTSEQAALAGRSLQTSWSQYLKRTCTTPPTTTGTTTSTTSPAPITRTPPSTSRWRIVERGWQSSREWDDFCLSVCLSVCLYLAVFVFLSVFV